MIEELEKEKQAISDRITTLRDELFEEVKKWTEIISKIYSQKTNRRITMTRTELEREIKVMEDLRESLTIRIHDVSSSLIDAYHKMEAMKEAEKAIDDLL